MKNNEEHKFRTCMLHFWSSRWNCGDSIISASSGTSHASVRTIRSLLRIQPTGSVYVYVSNYIHACDRSMLTWCAPT